MLIESSLRAKEKPRSVRRYGALEGKMRYRFAVFFALAVFAAVVGIEVSLKARGELSKEATEMVMQMAVGSTCPDKPEALRIATSRAYSFSLRRPWELPPWRVFQASKLMANSEGVQDNMFAEGFCNAIINSDR
ncbi:hypothetical protein [Pseudodonghicola flavimaris]|uniref:Uncharacterized protein n=1 Tax=Pseudodonghicola flavimaris TaxID=3050036 RepID=A0ABT7F830_9RHOB|nr:hypothetical protein [Pseudodonghicola flavimaris]MDK3020761.1 hypothetical protein [Pseudodonghicola flavimaris]